MKILPRLLPFDVFFVHQPMWHTSVFSFCMNENCNPGDVIQAVINKAQHVDLTKMERRKILA